MDFLRIFEGVRNNKIVSIKFFNKTIYTVEKGGLFSKIELSEESPKILDLFKLDEKILDFDVYENVIYVLTDKFLYSIDLESGKHIYAAPLRNYFKIYKPKFSKFDGVFALGDHISIVNKSGVRELFGLKERYFDIVSEDIYKQGELNILLRSLWGFTIFDLKGNQISHRTFGDVIVDAKTCLDFDSGKIFVGSKNGGFYIFNAKEEIIYNIDLGKSLYTFDVVPLHNNCLSYVLIWCSYDGVINYVECKEDKVLYKTEITKLNEPCDKLITFRTNGIVYLVVVQGEKIEIWKVKEEK